MNIQDEAAGSTAGRPLSFWLTRPLGLAASRLFLAVIHLRARRVAQVTSAPLLVVVPHQDDETLGCGGLIALKRRAGARVAVVYTTDGVAFHRRHPLLTLPQIAAMRRDEAIAALGRLSVERTEIRFLDGPDGALEVMPAARRAALVERLAGLVREFQPAVVATTLRSDIHRDHEATFTLVQDALRLASSPATMLEFPLWARWYSRVGNWALPWRHRWQKLDCGPVREMKQTAVAEYASQLRPLPPWTTRHLRPAFVRRCTGRWELFMGGRGREI